jgi:hypothetical protein
LSGGIFTCGSGEIKASNCLIVNNFYYGVSNGCNSGGPGAIELINCTVTNNHAGLYCMGEVSVLSSVIYDNLYNGLNYDITGGGTLTMNNTLIQGGYEGEGNIDGNPLFCYPDSGDYTLAENSPCVGTGEGGSNIGAFGVGCEPLILEPVLTDISDHQIEEDGDIIIDLNATSAIEDVSLSA